MLFLIQWQRERHQLRRRHSGVPARAGGRGRAAGAGGPRAASPGLERCWRGRSPEAIPAPGARGAWPLGGRRREAAAPAGAEGAGHRPERFVTGPGQRDGPLRRDRERASPAEVMWGA